MACEVRRARCLFCQSENAMVIMLDGRGRPFARCTKCRAIAYFSRETGAAGLRRLLGEGPLAEGETAGPGE
jgi:hypothetical protein